MASLTCLWLFLVLLSQTTTPVWSYNKQGGGASLYEEGKRYRTHIVLVEPPRSVETEAAGGEQGEHRRWHESFLPSPVTRSGEPRLVHSYTEVLSGFAARLSDAELAEVARKPGFLRAFPDRTLRLATTRTPAFLGLSAGDGMWRDAAYGRGVVIGLLDTGIHAAHPSFSDAGVAPPPARWKGSCAAPVRCNNKLIGARSLVAGDGGDASDRQGHGTHTASTAGGSFVPGASWNGQGAGTASGMAPGAHVAMYKVCTDQGCDSSAILAGLDAAVRDGVDVLSLSLGDTMSPDFDEDPLAIGSFGAVARGITVVCAAGNGGPMAATVVNVAPWMLTVAAGSVDRRLPAELQLRNGPRVNGEALITQAPGPADYYPLLYSTNPTQQRYCEYQSRDRSIAGKIVLCEAVEGPSQKSIITAVTKAGAAGVVLINSETHAYTTVLRDYGQGVIQVPAADGVNITDYASATSNAAAAITFHNSTELGVRPSPAVASFSGRGPSEASPGVLKPDIMAPGLNILAAWPPVGNSAGKQEFNIISGTSMATPHVSGVAALVRSVHPDWSPAAIRSAILTTADAIDNSGGHLLNERHERAGARATGAGHVNPARAADPGLVYDLGVPEYASYICSLLGDRALATIARNASLSCAKLPRTPEAQLNYPTITVPLSPAPFTVNRTVTNVGPPESTYTAEVNVPHKKLLTVRVSPDTLVFSKVGEKRMFSVTVSGRTGDNNGQDVVVEGSLRWVSAKHVVRSPIVAVVDLRSAPPTYNKHIL